MNPAGQPCEPTCSALAAETGKHSLRHILTAASRRRPQTAGDMAAVLDWRLPALTLITQVRCPGSPVFHHCFMIIPSGGAYLAKRSQLVADLANQVQDQVCQGDAEPTWAAPGSHPSTALVREIAVWRAANGINPQDPRPTRGGGHLQTAPALWKQRLTGYARATDRPADARADERQAARTASVRRRQPTPVPKTRTASEQAAPPSR